MTDQPQPGPTFANQQVTGYRQLTDQELTWVENAKALERMVAEFWRGLVDMPDTDKRWLAIARTDIQTGFSAMLRALGRPHDPFEG